MPILYYPSRIGNDGAILNANTSGPFRIQDNGGYATINSQSTNAGVTNYLKVAIWDKRFGFGTDNDTAGVPDNVPANKAYNADTYLLFAAGADRKYFTKAKQNFSGIDFKFLIPILF